MVLAYLMFVRFGFSFNKLLHSLRPRVAELHWRYLVKPIESSNNLILSPNLA